jgi:restriction system protein
MFGGRLRYEAAWEDAQELYAAAQARHQKREAVRQRKVAAARADWRKAAADASRKADVHNAHIDHLIAGFRQHDRFAVSEYVQMVLDKSPYPDGFPAKRTAGYVPESSLLAVEQFLPTFDIIPKHKAFRHVKTRKAVEPIARPLADAHRLYKSVIAQLALRTMHKVFEVTPDDMVSTVVVNGHVDSVDPATGRRIQPLLISVRATRDRFREFVPAEPLIPAPRFTLVTAALLLIAVAHGGPLPSSDDLVVA